MSNLKVNTINDANGNGNTVLYGVAAPVNSMGFRNRIINGDMRIDQRNAGASVTPTASVYTLDRWLAALTQASKFSVEQTVTGVAAPVGFTDYLAITSSSAYSVAAGDFFLIRQYIEGFNFADLAWGTASAQSITLSFWVRSSLTGTFGGSLQNSAENRSYPFTYTISAANTWEQKSITIAGDTSGTWIGSTNGVGLRIALGLGVGSTYNGTAGAWAGADYRGATGATSVVGTSGATFYITGVQLEAGSVASPFERVDYGRELMMCQRYYSTGSLYYEGYQTAGSPLGASANNFPVTMRAAPTLTYVFSNLQNAAQGADRGVTTDRIARYCLSIAAGTATALEAYKASVEL